MSGTKSRLDEVLIAGGGVIGLACAWRAARRGLKVRVVERSQALAGEATGVAAGMLAPVGEASWGEEALLDLGLASLEMWEAFASELESDSGRSPGYRRCGALHVALDRDEAAELRRRLELHERLGLGSGWMLPGDCRGLEPALSPKVAGGLHAPDEAAADPVALANALEAAIRELGGEIELGAEIVGADLSDAPELTLADGRTLRAERLVVATGAWSGSAEWLPRDLRPPVRPVKGEILTLRGSATDPVCRGIVAGERVYMVPREDGRLLVGATVEEKGFDTTLTAGGVHELLREAYRVVPEVAELEFAGAATGLRPGSPDNAPIVGHAPGHSRVLLATGHFRNGVLLAPVTGEAVAAMLQGDAPRDGFERFSPDRFESRADPASATPPVETGAPR